MKTQPALTPEQQAEQVSQFDSVFPDVARTRRFTLKGKWTAVMKGPVRFRVVEMP